MLAAHEFKDLNLKTYTLWLSKSATTITSNIICKMIIILIHLMWTINLSWLRKTVSFILRFGMILVQKEKSERIKNLMWR